MNHAIIFDYRYIFYRVAHSAKQRLGFGSFPGAACRTAGNPLQQSQDRGVEIIRLTYLNPRARQCNEDSNCRSEPLLQGRQERTAPGRKKMTQHRAFQTLRPDLTITSGLRRSSPCRKESWIAHDRLTPGGIGLGYRFVV